MSDSNETITIPKKQYEDMKRKLYWLECLRSCGVDNWEGFEFAIDEYTKKYPDEEDE